MSIERPTEPKNFESAGGRESSNRVLMCLRLLFSATAATATEATAAAKRHARGSYSRAVGRVTRLDYFYAQ